ncbi:MAG: hypothetical protein KIT24_12895 [Phycisphaeraceae bacterium]|nr:hypothetical protein [Phycisphaeraceae bacterium]
MVMSVEDKLGVGLYTAAEAAMYVRARPEAISRWVHGNAKGERVVRPQFDTNSERVITFVDMVQALSVRAVRTQAKSVPLPAIRDAVRKAEDEHGIQYPLARRHLLFYFDKSVFIKLNGSDSIVGLTSKDIGQHLLRPIVEPYLEEISFDDDGLAETWTPMSSGDLSIRLDPAVRFGQPIVAPLNILASTLSEAVVTEGSIEAAAEAHGVDRSAVLLAVKYFDSLTGLAA